MSTERMDNTALCNEIIARIKARPEMWSFTHPLYRARAMHKNFWHETSEELGVDENLLRKRWKHLKDQYRKELKRSIEKSLPEEGIAWKYFEPLQFLRDEVLRDSKEKSTPTMVESDEESDEEEKVEVPRKVRIVGSKSDDTMKLHMIYQGLMETKASMEERMKVLDDVTRHDPEYMYLMSLLPTLKQLSEIQKLQLKGKINEWLLEALTTNEYIAQCDTKYIVADIQGNAQK